jgi:hypothetical protein
MKNLPRKHNGFAVGPRMACKSENHPGETPPNPKHQSE